MESDPQKTLRLLVPRVTPRLRFAADVLFHRLLGLSVQLVPIGLAGDFGQPEVPTLSYGLAEADMQQPVAALCPSEGLVFAKDLREYAITVTDAFSECPQIRFHATEKHEEPSHLISSDIISIAFYWASEYESYLKRPLDGHGRILEPSVLPFRLQMESVPVLHVFAKAVRIKLTSCFPALKFKEPASTFHLTLDLDQPWLAANKPKLIQLGGLAKAIARRPNELAARLRVMLKRPDPFDVYDKLETWLPPEHTTLFILLNGKTKFDNKFGTHTPALRKLARQLYHKGYKIGLHPSYAAAEAPEIMAAEHLALEQMLNKRVRAARFHYGRCPMPNALRALESLRIEYDFTTFPVQSIGFKHGLAVPFPFFDVADDSIRPLVRVPTHVMDRTFVSYLKSTPAQAVKKTESIRKTIEQMGGQFTLLVHNELFSGYGQWKSWKPWSDWVRRTFNE